MNAKSLFRNILHASLVESISCSEACKSLKTWDLRLLLSVTE